jgi:hypothetical protein
LDHLYHFSLLNLLHLPYLIQDPSHKDHEYSRLTCVTASREVLARLVTYKTFERVTMCGSPVIFLAVMAIFTLLLTHINSHSCSELATKVLALHRPGDRAFVTQVLENMETVAMINGNIIAEKGAILLRKLMHVEADASKGQRFTIERLKTTNHQPSNEAASGCNQLVILMPYFGTVRIARADMRGDGVIGTARTPTRSVPSIRSASGEKNQCDLPDGGSSSGPTASHVYSMIFEPLTSDLQTVGTIPGALQQQQPTPGVDGRSESPSGTESHQKRVRVHGDDDDDKSAQRSNSFQPFVLADVNDWALQGVESAFFESLMNGIDGPWLGNNASMSNFEWSSTWEDSLPPT